MTEQEVLKKFEELGYRIFKIEKYEISLYKHYKQYNEDYAISIDLQNKCYYCDDMDIKIDMKTHQLLTELFKCYKWI